MDTITVLCIGKKISNLRHHQGLSQREFSKLVGISPSYLSKLESTTSGLGASLEVLSNIATALDIELSELFHVTRTEQRYMEESLLRKSKKKRRRLITNSN